MHKRRGKGRYFLSWYATKSDICVWWTCSWSQLHQLSACFNSCRCFWWSLPLMPGRQILTICQVPFVFYADKQALMTVISAEQQCLQYSSVFFPATCLTNSCTWTVQSAFYTVSCSEKQEPFPQAEYFYIVYLSIAWVFYWKKMEFNA